MMTDTRSPVAVVTGAASGIGAAIAEELSERGWTVASLDLADAPGCAWSARVDMRDSTAVSDALEDVTRDVGPISAAISVAGYYEMTPIVDISNDQWNRMLAVHLGGLVNLTRASLPGMLARGKGSIVAITSELAIGGGGEDAHYAAAKGAIIGFVRSLAPEVAAAGVRINAVAPGPTDTPLLAANSPWRSPEYLATLPLRRLGTAHEAALCVAWLVDEGSFCVGEIISPNAGAVI